MPTQARWNGCRSRGKGKFVITEYIATDERPGPRFPLLLTTGRILSQYNVGAQTRRTDNIIWHEEDRLEMHPHDAEQRGVRDGEQEVAAVAREVVFVGGKRLQNRGFRLRSLRLQGQCGTEIGRASCRERVVIS